MGVVASLEDSAVSVDDWLFSLQTVSTVMLFLIGVKYGGGGGGGKIPQAKVH